MLHPLMIEATRKLISLYKAATVEKITELQQQTTLMIYPWFPLWVVREQLTRVAGSCVLCTAARKIVGHADETPCTACIHYLVTGCGCMTDSVSWDLLVNANTAEELWVAMQGRAAYLESLLDLAPKVEELAHVLEENKC